MSHTLDQDTKYGNRNSHEHGNQMFWLIRLHPNLLSPNMCAFIACKRIFVQAVNVKRPLCHLYVKRVGDLVPNYYSLPYSVLICRMIRMN